MRAALLPGERKRGQFMQACEPEALLKRLGRRKAQSAGRHSRAKLRRINRVMAFWPWQKGFAMGVGEYR